MSKLNNYLSDCLESRPYTMYQRASLEHCSKNTVYIKQCFIRLCYNTAAAFYNRKVEKLEWWED